MASERWRTEERWEYGLGDSAIGGDDRGRGRRCAGMGEWELAYEDWARISSTASSANTGVEWASTSEREGSTRNKDGCSVDRSIWQYERRRSRRCSPPHDVLD